MEEERKTVFGTLRIRGDGKHIGLAHRLESSQLIEHSVEIKKGLLGYRLKLSKAVSAGNAVLYGGQLDSPELKSAVASSLAAMAAELKERPLPWLAEAENSGLRQTLLKELWRVSKKPLLPEFLKQNIYK